jgi:hypothetical protein
MKYLRRSFIIVTLLLQCPFAFGADEALGSLPDIYALQAHPQQAANSANLSLPLPSLLCQR